MANSEPNVLVPMTLEEAARRWLSQQGLCAIDWATTQELAEVYRVHGPKACVYRPDLHTYYLEDKLEREARLKEAEAKRAQVF